MREKNSLGRFFDNKPKKNGIGKLYKAVNNVHNLRLSTRLLIVVGLLTVSAATLYSAPPASKYMPGETLNPNCGPGDLNCSVEIGVGGGGSNWSTNGVDVWRSGGNVGVGTGSPSARLTVDGGSLLVAGEMGEGEGITATGAGTRMFFGVTKGAFRAGSVTGDAWDDSNVGEYSVAFGYNTVATGTFASSFGSGATASGHNSTAFGYNTIASGAFAVSFGYETEATHNFSTAFGYGTKANSTDGFATAFGNGTTASGWVSTAFGLNTLASGSRSTAWGQDSVASHDWSTAWGMGTEASGSWSTAWGQGSTASGDRSTAWGLDSVASGDRSTAFGHEVEALGVGSTAFGWNSTASGFASTAFGDSVVASGDRGVAFGQGSEASGDYSTAFGFNTVSSNTFSTALGFFTTASGLFSTALGTNTVASSFASTVLGSYNTLPLEDELQTPDSWILTDELFVIGNGLDNDNRSNALTILKNGDIGVGASAHLNWGTTIGAEGYGFRDNGGVMEFKDAGGNWIALNSLSGGGGGGESLWTLHSNGQDIYRNGGNVGVNTTNPTAQFESTSAAIAAWFRGLMGEASEPWDFAAMVGSGRYELGSDDGFEACDVSGGAISPDGTKMFLAGHCFLTGGLGFDHDSDDRRLAFEPSSPNSLLSVHEYDLTTPWDVNSAVDTGRSYDPFIEADAHPRDVTFSPDGFSMYVINDDPDLQYNSNPPYGAVIHEYALSEAWTFEDGITHVGSKVLNSAHVDYAYNLEFNSDGTKVFLTGEYNDGSIWASVWGYELTDPYDITTLQEPAVTGGLLEEHIVGTFFGSSGDKFFVLVEMYPEEGYEILEIELDTPWNLDDLHTMDSERYVVDLSDLDNSEHLPTDLILKLDGSGFYTTFSSIDPFDWNGPMSGGISQYIGGGPQVQGGTVIVDGNVGIGTETPTAKLESVSSRIAGWFRGLTGAQPDAYDIDKAQHTYTLDIYEGCNGVVTRFTPDGLKMFLVSSCEDYWGAGDISYIDEFELTVPWDISTAAPGDYYEPDYYDDESGSTYGVLDVAFSDDGTSMFVLIDNWYGEQGEIYQYELSTPWSVGDVIDNDERATFPEGEFGSAYKMRFSDDGHRLFLMTFTPGLDMYDPPMAEMYEFELSTPWDITTVDSEERNSIIFTEQNSDVLSIPFGSFDFSEDGETLFVATQDEVWGGSGTTYNAAIRKYSLGIPWSLDDGPGFEKSYHIAPGFRDFSDLTFKSDGLGFYIVENPAGFSASAEKGGGGFSTQASEPAGEGDGGVHQFVITPETTGGTVLVEGNLGVGTLAPTSKLTVVGNSELQGDVRISGNVNLGDSVDLDVADGAFIISQTGEGVSLTGEGSRMVFIPHLSAFRAGEASYDSWNPVNIGRHSAAFGEYTIASGSNSSAFGRNTTASGGSSVAFGQSTIASGISSTAFGWNTEAGGYYSTALGYQSAAYGRSSVAMGYGTIARSFASVALGFYNHDDPSYDDYYSVQTDPIFVIGNGINQNYRSNAFTVLKNGNVGLSDSAYLNFGASDGVSIGETGYGFRDNNGVVEFRDREGGWIPLHSLGGGESGSLWVLNDAGDAIFNNGGRVGINTLDSDPGYQLEVASDSFAARFRASLTQWDKNNIQEDGHHEIQWDCYVASPNFNSNGTKMFAIRDWDCSPGGSGSAYIYEYDLSAPWDVTTAVQASSFYLNYYVPGKIIAATFNQDGKRMFLLSYNGDGDVSLNQFELGTAWKVDTLSYAKSTPIAVNSGTLSMATSLKLSRDGSSLYVLSLMDQSPLPAAGHIIQYSLREPWDISSLNEEANVNFSSADLPDISIAQLFDISSDGRRLFVGTLDITVADPSPYEVTIREYSLAEPWVISGAIEISDSVIESGSDSADATQFTGFVFRTDGRNAYTAQIASSSENARITQYEIGGGVISGGGVIVDGDLGVGTDSPLYKFHVSTTGTGSVAGFTNENGTCTIDPNTSSLSCSSDERLKTEVLSLGEQESEMSSLDKLMLLRPVSYRWNAEAGTNAKLRYGLIAQEVDDVFPELVTRGAYLDPEDISKGRTLSVSYGGFTPFFIDAIQELNTRIDTALLGLVIDGTVSEENLGGSLGDIITRALKNTVLTVKELVTGKVRTNELCIEDENGTTCIDRKDLDELLGNEKGTRTENTNNPGNNPDNEGTSNTTNPEDDEDGKDEDGDETVTDPEAGQGGNQGDAGDTDPDEGAQGNGDEGAGQPDDATSGGSTSDDEEGE